MKICSLQNENLQFAKWESVVYEMTICSLGNDNLLPHCIYSDILNRKFPPKKLFRPENSDCAECVTFSLPCINLSSGIFERQTATGSKTSFLFICLDATTFVLISVITLIEMICLKICPRTTAQEPLPKNAKVHFRWPLKRVILTRNVTRYSNEPIKYIIVVLLFTFEHGGFNVL